MEHKEVKICWHCKGEGKIKSYAYAHDVKCPICDGIGKLKEVKNDSNHTSK